MKTILKLFFFLSVILGTNCPSANAQGRQAYFELFGTDSTSIVMLGNSLTAGVDWHELLHNGNVVNRGIVGDTSIDIMNRLDCVTSGKPAKIFLLAGVNDISHDLTPDSVMICVNELLDSIQSQTPDTKLYLQSLLPINNSFERYKTMIGKEQTVRDVNVLLKQEAEKRNITFIDLYDAFCDEDQNLKADWTADGLHLLLPAYVQWRDLIIDYINE